MVATLTCDAEVTAILADLEDLWRCADHFFGSLTPADWHRRHGPDWTYADVPYHLSYFDVEQIARPLEVGTSLPIEEQKAMRSVNDINAWNKRMFALRPAGETPEQSLQRYRVGHERIRQQAARLTDADLEAPAFMSLPGAGWIPTRSILEACVGHTWAHLTEARLRLGRTAPTPSASTTHRAIGFFMSFMPRFADPAECAKGPFTAVMSYKGVGDWTLRIADGVATGSEGAAPNADLVLTQTAETFEKLHSKIANPMWLMLKGEIKVKGFGKMGRYGKLFAMPGPDVQLEPARERL